MHIDTVLFDADGVLLRPHATRRDAWQRVLGAQEPTRATHMSSVLGYARLFDREFYSCRMGTAKPALEYFGTILSDLNARPGGVLM